MVDERHREAVRQARDDWQSWQKTVNPVQLVFIDETGIRTDMIRSYGRAKGARLLYSPPYSPDLNPIEQAFSKLKVLLRKAKARSFDTLCQTLGKLLEHVAKQECVNDFQNEPI